MLCQPQPLPVHMEIKNIIEIDKDMKTLTVYMQKVTSSVLFLIFMFKLQNHFP